MIDRITTKELENPFRDPVRQSVPDGLNKVKCQRCLGVGKYYAPLGLVQATR